MGGREFNLRRNNEIITRLNDKGIKDNIKLIQKVRIVVEMYILREVIMLFLKGKTMAINLSTVNKIIKIFEDIKARLMIIPLIVQRGLVLHFLS